MGNDPRELKKSHKREAEKKVQGPTFQQLVDAYLACGETKQPKPMKPRTVQDYRNKLVNQMMRELLSNNSLKQLAYDSICLQMYRVDFCISNKILLL